MAGFVPVEQEQLLAVSKTPEDTGTGSHSVPSKPGNLLCLSK